MKIGCSSYSFRNEWEKKYDFNKQETWKELHDKYPEIAGWEILTDHLEQFLQDIELEDLKKYQSMLNQAGMEWFAITAPSGVFVGNDKRHWVSDEEYLQGFKREKMFRIGFAEEWIERAGELGITQMRIDCMPFEMNHKIPYSDAFKFNVQRNIETYGEICDMAKNYGIEVGIENHGGFASDLKVLEGLFESVPELKLTFDFGNVTDAKRFEMLERFSDRINFVHAKAHVFDDSGEEKYIDFGQILDTLRENEFDGYLSIEWEGPLSGDEGVRKSIDLLQKYL